MRLINKPDDMDNWQKLNQQLIEKLRHRGISDERVLQAMLAVPRHEFVPADYQAQAYEDTSLPIGWGQTISQPYVVAYTLEQLLKDKQPGEINNQVLEVGSGSGYVLAILSHLFARVYGIEIIEPLYKRAKETLRKLGISNVLLHRGDGRKGWPKWRDVTLDRGFEAIVVSAGSHDLPLGLIAQLALGGRMVLPMGQVWDEQYLVRLDKDQEGQLKQKVLIPVRFVPLVEGDGSYN